MIVFDLICDNGHLFEGWFGSSGEFADQKESGLLSCPQCGCEGVSKAPMAPAVAKKGNQKSSQNSGQSSGTSREEVPGPVSALGGQGLGQIMAKGQMPVEVQQALKKLAEAQSRALEKSTWVGKKFADDARAMHYGERDASPIHGETSLAEAQRLVDEGIDVAPLPFPIAPPEDLN